MQYPESTPSELARGGRRFSRRAILVGVATGLAGCTSGITDDPSFPEADIITAPDGELAFRPDSLTVSVGETVRWGFAKSGHNVSCRPGDNDAVVLPDGAEPFASYGAEADPEVTLVLRGDTYEHIFEVAGTHVCIPHAGEMVGTIRVEQGLLRIPC
jgi:plastocyanin